MKTKSIIVAGLVFLFSTAFIASNAQSPAIKVLPSSKEGVVKLIVVGATDNAVDVKFYNEQGFIQGDEIRNETKAFTKKYNVKKCLNRTLLMEITADGASVTYQLAKTNDRLIPYLVKTTYTYPVVASNQ